MNIPEPNEFAKVPAMDSITLPLVMAIEDVWAAIRERVEAVPRVVVTVGSGTIGERAGTIRLGHFAASRWERGKDEFAELFVAGEGLARGAKAILGTLLHEAAHGVAFNRGIQDTSRNGRYHNAKFKALAEELGLIINQVPGIGWSETIVPDETAKLYAPQLAELSAAITAFRRSEHAPVGAGSGSTPTGGGTTGTDGRLGTGRKSNNNGVSLACSCGRKMRMSISAYEDGAVICGKCLSDFKPVG